MRILVTGSEGKIAKELLKLLEGHDLLLVDKKSGCNLAFDDLKFITDFKPEVVFHLAASFERTDETPMFHQINYEDNILATYRLNKLIAELDHCPKAYIYASSYLVYDPMLYTSEYLIKIPTPLSEAHETYPRNLIGAAKFYGEAEINFLKRNVHKDMKVCHARIFRVYGDGGQEFISRIIQWKRDGFKVDVWKPENKFDYVHTSDCASALKTMMDKELCGVYNVGYGMSHSIGQIIDLVDPVRRPVIMDDPYEWSVADTSKLEEETDWKPKVNLMAWIKERL